MDLGEPDGVAAGEDEVGVVEEPVDDGVGDGLGHELVEPRRLEVRRQRNGAAFVGDVDDA